MLHARARVASHVHRTPLWLQHTLSERLGRPVLLKAEHLQKTGSFKVRGILNHIVGLSDEEKAGGVVTISAGNAAQAVAWAATRSGVPCTVVMPEGANALKVTASRGYGADVILHGTASDAFRKAFELAEERGLRFVHPFDHPDVIAGHGTAALEIHEDAQGLVDEPIEHVVVPCGGGGLVAGIAIGTRAAGSQARVWCVEPVGAAGMHRSLEAGEAVHLDSVDTVADGLAAPMAGEYTYAVVRDEGVHPLLVDDDAIRRAMRTAFERTKQVLEPAGATGLAALLEGLVPGTGPVAVVLSGGNVDAATFSSLIDIPPAPLD